MPSGNTVARRKCDDCRKKRELIQRSPSGRAFSGDIPPVVNEVVSSPGHPLEHKTRAFMEQKLGHDFGKVRVHTDGKAAESAAGINALAYTAGTHIVFGAGHFSPGTMDGRKLLAHELAHVVQQSRGGPAPPLDPDSVHEYGANRVAEAITGGGEVPDISGSTGIGIARQTDPDAYVKPRLDVLNIMNGMSDELDVMRAGASPAKSVAQEASRTYCIVKVVDAGGKVKATATGAYSGKGTHAEQIALNKLNLTQIAESDTVLVMVDQLPCDDKCTPYLNKFKNKVPGEFRVFTKVKVNPETRMGGSPKTAAMATDKSSQELMELTEFQKRPAAGVKPAAKPAARATGRARQAKSPAAAVPSPTAQPESIRVPPPKVSISGTEMREMAASVAKELKSNFRILRAARVLNGILAALAGISAILTLIEFMDMAKSGLAGEGFIFTEHIRMAEAREAELKALESSYQSFSDSIQDSGPKLFKIGTDPSAAADILPSIRSMVVFLNSLQDGIRDSKAKLRKTIGIVSAKHMAAERILEDPKASGALAAATFGTAILATIFAAMEDLSRIEGSLNSSLETLDKLDDAIGSDVSFLNSWYVMLFEVCAKAGKCGANAAPEE